MATVDNVREEYQHLVDSLREQRDDIKVQIHLASMEVRDEWNELEKKWQRLQRKGDQLKGELSHSKEEVGEALGELASELKDSYQRIRRLL